MHSSSKAACGLALLTGLSLAAASAHAQTLTLGQSGNTTLSGTATLTNAGTTASGTYTYDDQGTGVPLASQNNYDRWAAYGPSTANIIGGTIGIDLSTYDTSTANVSGGHITYLFTYNTSTANVISGGSIGNLYTDNTSTANVSGGTIGGLVTSGPSTANVTGGIINQLDTLDTSTANVTGGSFSNLDTFQSSTLDLFGTGFNETFVANDPNYTEYAVTGTLQNGDPLNAGYFDFGGTLEFNGVPVNPVPEASSFVSLGLLLLLGVGGLAVSRRRRAAG